MVPLQKNMKYALIFMSFAFATHVAYNLYFQKKKRKQTEVNEVLIFSQSVTTASGHNGVYQKYVPNPSMQKLLYYLKKPRYSMDVCMYVLTSQDMMNAIMKLRYKGVKIRVIVDAGMAFSSGSQTRKLEKQGIPVRWMKSTNIMHHKFCLIDTSNHEDQNVLPLLMTGSLNWTTQALHGNWEHVIVTSQQELVSQCKAEFDRLWELFKPIV